MNDELEYNHELPFIDRPMFNKEDAGRILQFTDLLISGLERPLLAPTEILDIVAAAIRSEFQQIANSQLNNVKVYAYDQ